jgi:hypothetical protein
MLRGLIQQRTPSSQCAVDTHAALNASHTQAKFSIKSMQQLNNYLSQLASQRFYGTVTLKYEAGHVVLLKREETLKPNELLSGNPKEINGKKQA